MNPRRLPRLGRRSERPVSQGRSRSPEISEEHGDLTTINGDLMVIQWFNNGLTMVNNGMIWELPSGYDCYIAMVCRWLELK